jgi:hypothetical protein
MFPVLWLNVASDNPYSMGSEEWNKGRAPHNAVDPFVTSERISISMFRERRLAMAGALSHRQVLKTDMRDISVISQRNARS